MILPPGQGTSPEHGGSARTPLGGGFSYQCRSCERWEPDVGVARDERGEDDEDDEDERDEILDGRLTLWLEPDTLEGRLTLGLGRDTLDGRLTLGLGWDTLVDGRLVRARSTELEGVTRCAGADSCRMEGASRRIVGDSRRMDGVSRWIAGDSRRMEGVSRRRVDRSIVRSPARSLV